MRRTRSSATRRSVLAGVGSLLTAGAAWTGGASATRSSTKVATSSTLQVEDQFDETLTRGIWEIHYYNGFEDDAEQVGEWLTLAQDTLNDDSIYPHEYDRTTPVLLHREGEHSMFTTNAGHWWNQDGTIDRSVMEMVTPSEHQFTGQRRNEWYVSAIGHEYVHLPQLKDFARSFDAPSWFTEGMPEYLSNHFVLPAAGFEAAVETEVDDAIRSGDGYSFFISNEMYPGGQRLFQFLAEEFGPAEATSLTRSEEPTLMTALEKDLGLDPVDFEGRWLQWAAEHIGGEYDLPSRSSEPTGSLTRPRQDDVAHPESEGTGLRAQKQVAMRQRRDLGPERIRQSTAQNSFTETLSTSHFEIQYHDGYDQDAETVADWLTAIVTAYDDLYDHPDDLTTDVLLYRASEYSQYTLGATPGDTIEMVTPTDHGLDGSRRDSWYVNNIARPYVGGLVEIELPDDISVPDWLTLGVGNYIARNHVSDDLEFASERSQFRRLVENGSAYPLQIAGGYYALEGWFTESLIESTEGAFLADFLDSDASSLATRFEDGVGIHPYHVEVTFLQWLNDQYDAEYTIPNREEPSTQSNTTAESTPLGESGSGTADTSTRTPTSEDNQHVNETVTATDSPDATTTEETPGFGVVSALAGLGGAAYLLRNRFGSNE